MNYFSKNKYRIAITLLVVLNLALLATIWLLPKFRPPLHLRPEGLLKKELGLSPEQEQRFKELRSEHFKKTVRIRREIHRNKREMIRLLTESEDNRPQADSLTLVIASKQVAFENALIDHFLALRKICTPEQQEELGELFLEAMRPPGRPPQRK